jgi:hypothetical protein
VKRGFLAGAVLALAACGSTSTSSSSAANSTPTAKPLPAATAVEVQTSTNSSTVGFVSGSATIAHATFAPPQKPNVGEAAPIVPPDAVLAHGRIYYADAAGNIRYLARDGSTHDVTQFPLSNPQAFLSFWASPDGNNLMAIVIAVPALTPCPQDSMCAGSEAPGSGPLHLTIYKAQAGGTATQVASRDVSNNAFEAPRLLGWDASGPIVGVDAAVGTQDGHEGADFPYSSVAHLNADGSVGQPVGGAGCNPWLVLASGILCGPSNNSTGPTTFAVRTSGGNTVSSFAVPANYSQGAGNPEVSPAGDQLATTPVGNTTVLLVVNKAGTASVVGSPTDTPIGWLDNNTLVIASQGDFTKPELLDVKNHTPAAAYSPANLGTGSLTVLGSVAPS